MATKKLKPTPAKRKGVQTFIYPRPRTRAILERASKKDKVRLSNWVIIAALEKVATKEPLNPAAIEKLIPEEEYQELLRQRGKSVGK